MDKALHVPIIGMSCAACAARLEKQLNRQHGIQATINFATQSAEIHLSDDAPPLDGILAVIHQTGFDIPTDTLQFNIEGMTCAACSARLEKVLSKLPLAQAQVNLATNTASVSGPAGVINATEIIQQVQKAGFSAILLTEEHPIILQNETKQLAKDQIALIAALILTLPLLASMVPMLIGQHMFMLPRWLQFTLATPVQFILGWRFYRGAAKSLAGGGANMDVLVVLGTSMAWLYSMVIWLSDRTTHHVYFEASASVIALVLLGKYLEARARKRTTSAIAELMQLQPRTARIEQDGELCEVSINTLQPGAIVLVRHGEQLPIDGVVLEGRAAVDESMLTGESIPRPKVAGDNVFAGTRNIEGGLKIRAESVGSHTQLAEIVRLVASAQGSKAPIQRLADRIASIFVPVVVLIASLTLILTWWILGLEPAIHNAVAVLVIACPCALGLATPTAITVGVGLAARKGILFRNAAALETAADLQVLILDKTGTLTLGQPAVTRVIPVANHTETQLLQQAASLEAASEHPLAQAILTYAGQITLLPVIDFRALPGLGVEGQIEGQHIRIGVPSWAAPNQHEQLAALQTEAEQRQTQVCIAIDGQPAGLILLNDQVRPTSPAAITALNAMGIETMMLTGDNRHSAASVAKICGIESWMGDVRPQDKIEAILSLHQDNIITGMVGDGVNDAPALAAAKISFAMGHGSDVALAAADVTLMQNDLNHIILTIQLSRATLKKIRQNLFFAFIYNSLGIPLAALGLLNPVIAGAAMALSSVSVVTNALLLKRWRPNN